MKKSFNSIFEAGSRESNEPRLLSEVLDEYFASNSSLDQVCRNGLFGGLYPHTEPCCRLKLHTCEHRRLFVNECLNGSITHVCEDDFLFIENAPKSKSRRRYPCVYKGYCFNVHKKDDGTLFPTFRQPHYTRFYTFRDFCREASEELLMVAGLVEEKE